GRDPSEERNLGGGRHAAGREHFDGTALVVRAPDEALPLEIGEVLMDRCQRLEAEVLGDFLEARCVPFGTDMLLEVGEDLALPLGQGHGDVLWVSSRREPELFYPNVSRRARCRNRATWLTSCRGTVIGARTQLISDPRDRPEPW